MARRVRLVDRIQYERLNLINQLQTSMSENIIVYMISRYRRKYSQDDRERSRYGNYDKQTATDRI